MAKKLTVFVFKAHHPAENLENQVRTIVLAASTDEKSTLLKELRAQEVIPLEVIAKKKDGQKRLDQATEGFTPRSMSESPRKQFNARSSSLLAEAPEETFFRQLVSPPKSNAQCSLLIVFKQAYGGVFFCEIDLEGFREGVKEEIQYQSKESPPVDMLYLRKKNYLLIRLSPDGKQLSAGKNDFIRDVVELIRLRQDQKYEKRFMENIKKVLGQQLVPQMSEMVKKRSHPQGLQPNASNVANPNTPQERREQPVELPSEGSSAVGEGQPGQLLKLAKYSLLDNAPKDNMIIYLDKVLVNIRLALKHFIMTRSESAHPNPFVERIKREYFFGKAFINYPYIQKISSTWPFSSKEEPVSIEHKTHIWTDQIIQAVKYQDRETKNIDRTSMNQYEWAKWICVLDSVVEARQPLRLNDLREIFMDKDIRPEWALGVLTVEVKSSYHSSYSEKRPESPLLRMIIESLNLHTSDFFDKTDPSEVEPTELFRSFLACIGRTSPDYCLLLFKRMMSCTDPRSTDELDTASRFMLLIFSNKIEELKSLLSQFQRNEEWKNIYINWLAMTLLPSEIYKEDMVEGIKRFLLLPFKNFQADSSLNVERFYLNLLNSVVIQSADFPLCKHILESPHVSKETKLRFVLLRMFPQVEDEGSVGERVVKSFFSSPTPFPTDTNQVRLRDLLPILALAYPGQRDIFQDYRRALEKDSRPSVDIFLKNYDNKSIFHRVVLWVSKAWRDEKRDDYFTHGRQFNLFLQYHSAVDTFLTEELGEKIKIVTLLKITKLPEKTQAFLEELDATPGKKLRERLREDKTLYDTFEMQLKEILLEFQKGEIYRCFDFYAPTKDLLAILNISKGDKSVRDIKDSESWQDLLCLLGKEKEILMVLKSHPLFMDDLKTRSNKTVREFMQNILAVREAHKARLEGYATVGLSLKNYLDNFQNVSQKERSYLSLMGDLGVPKTIGEKLIHQAKQFETFLNLREIVKESPTRTENFITKLVSWSKFTSLKKESSTEFGALEKFKNALKTKGFDNDDITYTDLEKIDVDKLTERPEFLTLNPKLIENISKSEKLFKFVENNNEESIKQLKSECEVTYIPMFNDIEKLANKLDFLVHLKGSLDEVLKGIYAIEPSLKLEDLVGELEHSLPTLNHLKMKVTGDFNAIVHKLYENSLFIFKFDNKEEEFIYSAKSLEAKEKKEEGDVKADAYDLEDLTDYFTKASIRCNEFERVMSANPTMHEEDANQKALKGFRDLGNEIRELQQNLTYLYELGIIPKGVDEDIVKYLNKFAANSPFSIDKRRLLLKVHKVADAENGGAKVEDIRHINDNVKRLFEDLHAKYRGSIVLKAPEYHLLTYFSREKMYALIQFLKADTKARKDPAFADTIDLLIEASNNPDALQSLDNCTLVIDTLGDTFKLVCEQLKNCAILGKPEPPSSKVLQSSKVVVFHTNKNNEGQEIGKGVGSNEYNILLKMFSGSSSKNLCLSQTFYCTELTTVMEMEAFVARCFQDPLRRQYFLLNPAELSKGVQDALTNFIIEMSKNTHKRLVIFSNLAKSEQFVNPEYFQCMDDKRLKLQEEKQETYLNSLVGKLSKLTLVHSELSGEGKTFHIKKKAGTSRLLTMSLAGEIHKHSLANRFEVLRTEAGKNKFSLHVKLDYIENFRKYGSLIDYFLLSLCFAGKVTSEQGNCNLTEQLEEIFLEIGNSNKYKLFTGLGVVDLLLSWNQDNQEKKKLLKHNWVYKVPSFSNDRIEYKNDPISNEQIAAKFLLLHESAAVEEKKQMEDVEKNKIKIEAGTGNFLVPINAVDMKKVLSEDEFKRLLGKYFQNKHKTFFNFVLWTSIVAQLKRDLDSCSMLDPKVSKLIEVLDVSDLQKESNEEILLLAEEMLNLQSENARICQEKVVSIFDSPSNEIIQQKLDREKEVLKKLISDMKWNTSNLYIPLIVGDVMIPIVTNQKIFNKGAKRHNRRLASKRFFNYLESDFVSKSGVTSTERTSEHNWFVYLLSLLPLVNGKMLTTSDVLNKAANFDNNDLINATHFDEKKEEPDEGKKVPDEGKKEPDEGKKEPLKDANRSKKGFSLTKQTFTKLCLMIFKARINHPIIIMGESGCGKTYLSMFLAKGLLEDEFKMKTLYSGFSEADLVEFIEKCVDLALKLQKENKRLWVFFDEFNTTAIQSLIADVILDRVLPLSQKHKSIPNNMSFIACCNPYRIKLEKSDADIGLVPHEKASMLSHIVHPIPERLLCLVWDFGQLTEEDEMKHIHTMVKAEHFFEGKEIGKPVLSGEQTDKRIQDQKETELTQLVFRCHNTVRHIEERSGVSLRDVKRVFIFYRWFASQMHEVKSYFENLTSESKLSKRKEEFWMFRSLLTLELATAICAVTICYSLRLNGQREQQRKLTSLIYNWTLNYSGMEPISRQQVQDTYCLVAEIFLDDISDQIGKEITVNVPFKENFLTLLACYAERVPMIIVGAPGTSKTLSTNKLLETLDTQKDKYDLYKNFDYINKIYYGGSETSTSEGVQKVFNRAKKLYDTRPKKMPDAVKPDTTQKDKIQTPVIFFDELGLAELSPYNPLKVMHSELEDNLGKIAFIGISNWKPDQSKVNRMICLCRPDMSREDLINISDTTLNQIDSPEVKGDFRIANSCLAEAYLNFRVWQKSIGLHQNKSEGSLIYHPNFHGSRDIYGVFAHIFREVPRLKELYQGSGPEERLEICLDLIKEAVERNLNGESYIFGDNKDHLKTDILKNIHGGSGNIVLVSDPVFDMIFNTESISKRKLVRMDDYVDIYKVSKEEQNINPFEDQISFSLSSAEVFKLFFLNCLYAKNSFDIFKKDAPQASAIAEKFMEDKRMLDIVMDNIKDKVCRFMILRAEGSITEDLFVKQLRTSVKDKSRFIDWRATKDDSQVDDLLSYFKTYISDGYTVVMKDLDSLYGGLYDLFNQKYSKIQGKDNCSLYYGQTKHSVEVSPEFKCIVFLSSNSEIRRSKDIEKLQPAPFLNRFEKYFVQLSKILTENSFQNVLTARKLAVELSGGKTSAILGLSLDLLVSVAVPQDHLCNPFTELVEESELVKPLLQLATSNFLLLSKTSGRDVKLFSEMHKSLSFEKELTANFQISDSNFTKFQKAKGTLEEQALMMANDLEAKQMEKLAEELNGGKSNADKVKSDFEIKKDEIQRKFNQELEPFQNEFNKNKGKSIVLTFSTPLSLQGMMKDGEFPLVNQFDMENKSFNKNIDRYQVFEAQNIGGGGIGKRNEFFKNLPKESLLLIQFTNARDLDLIHPLRLLVDESLNVKAALFIVHVSIYRRERSGLVECAGLTFWNQWRLISIDRLEKDFSFQTILRIKDKPIFEAVLDEEKTIDEEIIEEEGGPDQLTIINDMKNWIVNRILTNGLESLALFEKVNGEIDIKRLKQGLEMTNKKQNNEYSEKLQKANLKEFFSFLINFKQSLKLHLSMSDVQDGTTANSNCQLTLTNSNPEIESLLWDDDYKNIENILAQAFFKIFKDKTESYLSRINAVCRNLSTCLLGLLYCPQPKLVAKYNSWLRQCLNDPGKIKVSGKEPKETYVPFTAIYSSLCTTFQDLVETHNFNKDRIRLYTSDYVKLKRIDSKKLTENQTEALKYFGQLIRKEEFNVLTITKNLIDEAARQVKKEGITIEVDMKGSFDLFIIDFIKRFYHSTLMNTTFRVEHYQCLLKLLSAALLNQPIEATDRSQVRELFPVLLYFMCFRDTAIFLIESIQKRGLRVEDMEPLINKIKSDVSSDQPKEESPFIQFDLVDAIAMEFNHDAIVPDLQAETVILDDYKQFLSDGSSKNTPLNRSLGIIYDMLKHFEGDGKLSSTGHTLSDKKKIYLSELKKCESIASNAILLRILQIGAEAFCDFMSIRNKEKEKCPLSLVQNFVELWCTEEKSFRVICDPPFRQLVFSSEILEEYEFMNLAKVISSLLFRHVNPFLFDEAKLKDTVKSIDENNLNPHKETLLTSGVNLVNYLAANMKDSRCNLLLQSIIHNIFLEAVLIQSANSNWRSEIRNKVYMVDQAIKIFKGCHGKPCFQFMLAVVLLRLYFNPELVSHIEDLTPKEPVDQSLDEVLSNPEGQEILEKMLQSAETYPFVYFMQRLFKAYGDNLSKALSFTVVQKYEMATRDPTDRTSIVFTDQAMAARYKEINSKVSAPILSYGANPTEAVSNQNQIKAVFEESFKGSKEANLFLCGCLAINTLVRTLKPDEQAQQVITSKLWASLFEKIRSSQTEGSKIEQVCRLIVNLANRKSMFNPQLFSKDSSPDVTIRMEKIMSQFILLTICFEKMGLSTTAWKNWNGGLPTNEMKCKVSIMQPLHWNAAAYLLAVKVRMVTSPYHPWGFGGYPQNIGIYMCTCGWMLTLHDCGYFTTSHQCFNPNCKRKNGYGNHDVGETTQTVHFKSADEICASVKTLYEKNTLKYSAHDFLRRDAESFDVLEAVEIPWKEMQASKTTVEKGKPLTVPQTYIDFENNIYFRHLVDHLYLGSLPLLMDTQGVTKYSELLSTVLEMDKPESLVRNLRNITITSDNDYFMAHIKNDLENLSRLVKLDSPTDVFDWFRAVLSRMAEKLVANENPDSQTKLYIERTIFTNPKDMIKEQDKQIDKSLQAVSVVTTTVKDLVKCRVNFEDPNTDIKDKEGISFCYKVFNRQFLDPAGIRVQFNASLDLVSKHYKLVWTVNKYERILMKFPFICMAQLDLSRYLTRKYNRRLSQAEAASKPLPLKTDPTLEYLYGRYLESWKLIDSFKAECPEVFTFGFMCQQEIIMTEYEQRVRIKENARVYDFLMVSLIEEDFDNKKYIFMKSIIFTLCKQIQNLLSGMMREELGYIEEGEKVKGMKGASRPIKGETVYLKKGVESIYLDEAHESDFLYLKDPLEKLIIDNTSVDVVTKGIDDYLIDYSAIQHKLAELMFKPNIIADDDCLSTFVFSKGISSHNLTELQTFFSYIHSEEELDEEIIDYMNEARQADDQELSRKIFMLVIEICEYLHSIIQTQDVNTPVLEIVENSEKNIELKERIREKTKEYKFPLNIKIPNLKAMVDNLKSTDMEAFISQHCDTKLSSSEKVAIDQLKHQALKAMEDSKDPSLRNALKELEKEIKKEVAELIYPDPSRLQTCKLEGLSEFNWNVFTGDQGKILKDLSLFHLVELRKAFQVL